MEGGLRGGVGSSPHTRGARTSSPPPAAGPGDHPRIRGEHAQRLATAGAPAGSSPHTRGAPIPLGAPAWAAGIIPAYAGSTDGPHTTSKHRWDHPRIRGEHFFAVSSSPSVKGSSPHTRGAPAGAGDELALSGIIPAYAGSTWIRSRSGSGSGDHPRIRGEHSGGCSHHISRGGSSPHTRGAPIPLGAPAWAAGIIPAYAGSTDGPHTTSKHRWDHPRIRGEH